MARLLRRPAARRRPRPARHGQRAGERGTARTYRGVTVEFGNASSPPGYRDGTVTFDVALGPQERWHGCVDVVARIDDRRLPLMYGCRSFASAVAEFDVRRRTFLQEATEFTSPRAHDMTSVVIRALDQAKTDLAALRLYDLDEGERAWTMAAGLPMYVALFGRDVITASWQGLTRSRTKSEPRRVCTRLRSRWE